MKSTPLWVPFGCVPGHSPAQVFRRSVETAATGSLSEVETAQTADLFLNFSFDAHLCRSINYVLLPIQCPSQKHCIQYNDMVYVGIRNTVITSNHVKRNMRLTLRVPELFLKCSAWHSTFKKGNEIWLKFLMFVSNHRKSSA